MKRAIVLSLALTVPPGLVWAAGLHDEIPFKKHTLDLGAAETCAVADINGDGNLDVVAGENWFEGPTWTPHRFRELIFQAGYLDAFSDYGIDVEEDGDIDVVTVGWFSKEVAWHENPGQGRGTWTRHVIDSGAPTEFAVLADLDNDGRALELLPQFGDEKAPLAWFGIEDGSFVKHVVSPRSYGHGIGAGDVNGDGRTDILTSRGWWEAPTDPRSGQWTHHEEFAAFEFPHLGFLQVRDVDGNGRPDVVTSYAHGYGILWLEQLGDGQWTRHVIDESWSQPHAVTLVDLNGDRQFDIVTGKRFHAHNGKDPGGNEPLGLYWYEHQPGQAGLTWKRHIIDYGSRAGGGMQIPVVDIDRDGDLDILAPGKSGLFLFENLSAK